MQRISYTREVCDILSASLVLLSGIVVAPVAGIVTARVAEMASISAGALFLSLVFLSMAAVLAGAPAVRPWLASQQR